MCQNSKGPRIPGSWEPKNLPKRLTIKYKSSQTESPHFCLPKYNIFQNCKHSYTKQWLWHSHVTFLYSTIAEGYYYQMPKMWKQGFKKTHTYRHTHFCPTKWLVWAIPTAPHPTITYTNAVNILYVPQIHLFGKHLARIALNLYTIHWCKPS